MHARGMYVCEVHVHEVYPHEMHAHKMHARKVYTHETPAHPLLWWLSGLNSGRFMYRHLSFKKRGFALVAGSPYCPPAYGASNTPKLPYPVDTSMSIMFYCMGGRIYHLFNHQHS